MRNRFTLIEVIISVIVIASLAAIVLVNVSSMKDNALTSMISSNISNMQTAVDKYRFDSNMSFPTTLPPTLDRPQEIDMSQLTPKYIKHPPDLSKEKSQRYWVDVFGKVWGSTVDAPHDYIKTNDFLEWNVSPDVASYQVYHAPTGNVSGAATIQNLRKIASIKVNPNSDKVKFETFGKDVLVSAIDKYGLETVPTGLTYGGKQEDWFSPLLNKEGSFNFEIKSFDTMYWEGFRSVERKPEGTSISFRFSVLGDDGEFTPYTTDFSTLPPSKHLKMTIELKGHQGKYPTLYDMRVLYHYAYQQKEIVQTDRIVSTNLNYDGTTKDPQQPVRVVDEFTMLPGKKVDSILNSDSYVIGNEPQTSYTYSQDGENFIPVVSFDQVPEGSVVRVEREYPSGQVIVRDVIVKQRDDLVTQDGNLSSDNFVPSTPPSGSGSGSSPEPSDPEVSDSSWKTVDTLFFVAHSGDGQKTRWLRAEVDEDIKDPVNTRIIYRYSGSNGGSWSRTVDTLSVLAPYQSVRLTAYLQVANTHVGKVEDPVLNGVRIINEQGVSDLSLVKPTVRVKPIKSNNSDTDSISTESIIEWSYEAYDPRGREIVDVEWGGDKRSSYPVGTYMVKVRVKNESAYWSDWVLFNFEVKEEPPVAIIRATPEPIVIGKSIDWSSSSSFDPDGDGIVRSEWAGDKKSIYDTLGTYSVRLRVQDKEGHWSDWTEKTFDVIPESQLIYRVEGEDTSKFSGIRTYSNVVLQVQEYIGASGGKVHFTQGSYSSDYASLQHSFSGTGLDIKLIDPKGMEILIDGVVVETISEQGPFVYSVRDLSQGTHKVVIRAKSSSASGSLDFIDVYGSDITPSISNIKSYQLDAQGIASSMENSTVVPGLMKSVKTSFVLDKNSLMTARVKDKDGKIVRSFLSLKFLTGGTLDTHAVVWDGKDDNGNTVASGDYSLELVAFDSLKKSSSVKTTILSVDDNRPIYRVEAEDSLNFKTYKSYSNAISRTDTLSSASNGKVQYVEGSYVNDYASLSHEFYGTGFDVKLLETNTAEILLDNVVVDTVSNKSSHLSSMRNLPLKSYRLDIRVRGSGFHTLVDYLDVYSSEDGPTISNVYSRQLDSLKRESTTNNNNLIVSLGKTVKTYFTLSKNSTMDINVVNGNGERVRNLVVGQPYTGGTLNTHSIVWDGRDLNGKVVPTGEYQLVFSAKGIKGTSIPEVSTPIFVDGNQSVRRIEAEDDTKTSIIKTYSSVIALIQDNPSASQGKVRYLKGSYSSDYAALVHNFVGNGFDLSLIDPVGTTVLLDGVQIEQISSAGETVISRRNLPTKSYRLEVRPRGSSNSTSVDYFDIYSEQDRSLATNLYTRQVDPTGTETMMNSDVLIPSLDSKINLYYTLDNNATVDLVVKDASQNIVKTLHSNTYQKGGSAGNYMVSWDGRNSSGNIVPKGFYSFELTTEGVSGTKASPVVQSFFVGDTDGANRVEGEDTSKFLLSKGYSNAVIQVRDYVGASANKVNYLRGSYSNDYAYAQHSFTGTGIDIKLIDPTNARVLIDGKEVNVLTKKGEALHSVRNLSSGSHKVIIRVNGSSSETMVDYIDIYTD